MDVLNSGQTSGVKTMTLLWSRVRQRGDLPGFSKAVSAIVGAMRGDDEREFNMTKTVLQDPVLTQKVLRLANSAMYSVFGQAINTVSKAVIVLGTEAIGHLALGLKLIDGLSAVSSESARTRAEMEKAVLAGHIARQIVSSVSSRDAEEAVVCAMLHSLGRMMAVFYLADRWKLVQERVKNGIEEKQATLEILGLGLDEIGRQAAQQWGLPSRLVNSMREIFPGSNQEPVGQDNWLAAVSTLSSRCATVLCDETSPPIALAALTRDYAEMLGLDASGLLTVVDAAQLIAAEEGAISGKVVRRPSPVVLDEMVEAGKPADAALLLSRGVADMRGAQQSASAAQLMSMALETIYQGLGFSRAVVFLRNKKKTEYRAQMCFGDGVQELLPRLVFKDVYEPDVFHAALANDKMIFVANAQNIEFIHKVPHWWKEVLPTVRSFMVLPLTVQQQPAGFLYGDWDMSRPSVHIEQEEIVPLNELRMLIVQSMEARLLIEPGDTNMVVRNS